MTEAKKQKAKLRSRTGRPAALEPRYYYKGNRLKQLRAFVYTVKLGTLARAAEALFLSQPSISLQLTALERELGQRLLERTRRRVTLSRSGEALYELARPLVEGWEQLDRDFRARVAGFQAASLTIAAGTSTIQYLLPPLVRAYRERHPDVRLELANVTGRDGLALLRADQADFAVGSMLDVPPDLDYAPVHVGQQGQRGRGQQVRRGRAMQARRRGANIQAISGQVHGEAPVVGARRLDTDLSH